MVNNLYLVSAVLLAPMLGAQQPCEKLKALQLPHTDITSAVEHPAGSISVGAANATPIELPARCIVQATARPTTDSEIKLEIWLPVSGWNGRYMQVGNGGWAGSIPVRSLANAIQRGYAAAGTNGGHDTVIPMGLPDGPSDIPKS